MFQAFLTAMRWSGISLAQNAALVAPFRSGVQIGSYQLAPLLRARSMPRVRLLIADDVGLGKTIATGLIVQDLVHSSRATSALVVCPAHLKEKWVEEMADKFGLEFRIIDGDSVLAMRKEFGPSIDPWASFPRLLTSIDYLKTEHPRRLFLEIARRRAEESGARRPWDLLILDEAHNAAPAGRQTYVRDSELTEDRPGPEDRPPIWSIAEPQGLHNGDLALAVGVQRNPAFYLQQSAGIAPGIALVAHLSEPLANGRAALTSVSMIKRAVDEAVARLRPNGWSQRSGHCRRNRPA